MTDGWDERELTDEQIDEMLADLDSHAREVDNYDLGLPLSTEHLPKLREIVRESLAARASAAPLSQTPAYEELREIPRLRELAKMVTESPCFTNAMIAVAEAWSLGNSASQPQPSAGQTEGK